MYPRYRKIPKMVATCPKCGEELSGNNSMSLPWKCKCGVWVTDDGLEFKVLPYANEKP